VGPPIKIQLRESSYWQSCPAVEKYDLSHYVTTIHDYNPLWRLQT